MSELLIVIDRRSSADTVNKGHANLSTLPRQRRSRHLLLQSNWLSFVSVTADSASCPLLLVDHQLRSSPHLFHASFGAADSRRIHEAGLRSGCRFLLDQLHSESRLNGLMTNAIGHL